MGTFELCLIQGNFISYSKTVVVNCDAEADKIKLTYLQLQ